MTQVTAQISVSLDGFYAGPIAAGDVPGWMEGPEAPGFFRVTRWVTDAASWRDRQGFAGGERSADSELIDGYFEAAGAYVMGRRMFDAGEVPWGDVPPFRAPVFVVTHRPREPLVREGGTTFTFVTEGPERAVELARAAVAAKRTGGTDVAVAGGGSMVRTLLGAGLVDRFDLHVVPVLLGDGLRLFDSDLGLAPDEGIELTASEATTSNGVVHLRYRIGGRRTLHLDDRGSGGGTVREETAASTA
ncbi:MAG: dihydrofolate reductase family protein [Actinomycetota bacterium]|nr:dihydrofolate reductase family protein [Actinomycetota bacterium]